MIVDANPLLYARNEDDPNHTRARDWLETALNGPTRIGLTWSSLGAFLRIPTNLRVFADPLSPQAAWQQVESWLDAPRAWVPPRSRSPRRMLSAVPRQDVRTGLVGDCRYHEG